MMLLISLMNSTDKIFSLNIRDLIEYIFIGENLNLEILKEETTKKVP